jgi:hypothetical protein
MIMKSVIFCMALMVTTLFYACDNEKKGDNEDIINSEIQLKKSQEEFQTTMNNRASGSGDPFVLNSVVAADNKIKISVSYSGGCKPHTFSIVWDETITTDNPPGINLIISHNANGDMCEAYITETIVFDASDILDSLTFENLAIEVHSAWSYDESVINDPSPYEFTFEESDICNVYVTAKRVVCGAGLYENLWLALDQTIHSGHEDFYFHYYLQPVEIANAISDFQPIEGKRYKIGAKIQNDHRFYEVPICLAYSGPSIPVKIICIEEVK